MDDKKNIYQKLYLTDVDQAVSAACDLAKQQDMSAIPELLNALKSASNHRVRSAIAYALGELHANEALPLLLDLLRSPETYGHRGSLAYALTMLDCSSVVPDLAALMMDPFFEVRQKVLIALESISVPPNPHDIILSIQLIDKFKTIYNIEEETKNDMDFFIEILENIDQNKIRET